MLNDEPRSALVGMKLLVSMMFYCIIDWNLWVMSVSLSLFLILELKVKLEKQWAPETQLVAIDKKIIGPESKCSHQINERQNIMPVHQEVSWCAWNSFFSHGFYFNVFSGKILVVATQVKTFVISTRQLILPELLYLVLHMKILKTWFQPSNSI